MSSQSSAAAWLPAACESISEGMFDAFFALDRDFRFAYVNRRASELFGRASGQLLGRHLWTDYPDGIGQPFHRACERALETQEAVPLEGYFVPFGGWYTSRVVPVPEGLLVFILDITAGKRVELELELSER